MAARQHGEPHGRQHARSRTTTAPPARLRRHVAGKKRRSPAWAAVPRMRPGAPISSAAKRLAPPARSATSGSKARTKLAARRDELPRLAHRIRRDCAADQTVQNALLAIAAQGALDAVHYWSLQGPAGIASLERGALPGSLGDGRGDIAGGGEGDLAAVRPDAQMPAAPAVPRRPCSPCSAAAHAARFPVLSLDAPAWR